MKTGSRISAITGSAPFGAPYLKQSGVRQPKETDMGNPTQASASWWVSQRASTLVTAVMLALTMIVIRQSAQAQTFTVIQNFTGGDGATPYSGLTMDAAGNFYGTTGLGGGGTGCSGYGCGSIYKLSRSGSGWRLTTLYSFNQDTDGSYPSGRVTFGPDGALYGSTAFGGGSGGCGISDGCGTVFKLTPPVTGCQTALCYWNKTVLYEFTGGSDGASPYWGDLIFDQAGNIYGTTVGGGVGICPLLNRVPGCGVVFELTPSNGGWSERVLHHFSGAGDGASPRSGVIFDQIGNLYGTTAAGGGTGCSGQGCGTIFLLTRTGSGWTGNILYKFQGGNDGANAVGGILFDQAGNLFGTTASAGSGGGGTIFELSPTNGAWNLAVLYSLTGTRYGGSWANLTMDTGGNLYGTTYGDGAYGFGNVFKLTRGNWTYTDLCDFANGNDVSNPVSSVAADAQRNLYGTASEGGADNFGVIWQIIP
jgi:uncharacterized repeat protein (TIGR03803 family)